MSWIVLNEYTNNSFIQNYINSLYFHWVTIFTIGYGDIKSQSYAERSYNILLMLFGIAVYSYTVTTMGSVLSKEDPFPKIQQTI